MRSRYTAYATGTMDYLLATWHPSTRPVQLEPEVLPMRWLGLAIRHISDGGSQDNQGSVEFIARCKHHGKAQRLHEISQFVRENGQWFYVDGKQIG
jgi:SEC-C motif domain protein